MATCSRQLKRYGKAFAFARLETVKFSSIANGFINKAVRIENFTKGGFTLIELLVVISIIGMLSTIAVVSLGSARTKSRDATRIATMKQLAIGLEEFYYDKGGYPPTNSATVTTATYAIGGNVLCAATTRGQATDIYSTTCTGTAYTRVPAYPTPVPGGGAAAASCPTGGSFPWATSSVVANYCYGADTAYTANTVYATTYQILWQVESSGNILNGTKCITSPSGVICT